MADLTREQIAELRRLHGEAVECRAQFEGRITARMADVLVGRLPAILDMAERCAKAEEDRSDAIKQISQHLDEIDSLKTSLAKAEAELAKLTCKCSLRTKLVGDGCGICNPEESEA